MLFLLLRVTSICFYPHLMASGRSVLRTDAVYWPCKEGSASLPGQVAFLTLSHSIPIQNTGTMQYWCGSQQASCLLQILCSPYFVWYSCWGNWLQDGQPLNLGTSSCGSHYWIALLGSAAFFLRASNFLGFIVKSLNCPGVPMFMAMLFYHLTYSAHVTAAALISFICVP